METIPYHYFTSEKLICITSNKVASRFLGSYFPNNSEFDIEVNKDFTFDPDTSFYQPNESKSKELLETIIEEYESIFSKKVTKDILILYRNPFDRVLSGLIQNFYSDLFISLQNNSYDFKLRKILKDYSFGMSLYEKLAVGYSFPNDFKKFSEGEKVVLHELCIDYIYDAPATSILSTTHTNPYISYIYTMVMEDKIDSNKLKLLDITSSKGWLETLLKQYSLENKNDDDVYQHISTSNKPFTHIFSPNSEILDLPEEYIEKIPACVDKINAMVADETFFYDKLKLLPQNFKG
jgi:hypothetical protein